MSWPFNLFRRQAHERELDAELRFHLEQQTRDNLAAGMSPEAAQRAAAIALGGLEQTKEACRDERPDAWLGHLAQDVRFGLRMLRKNPTFTAIAVLSLALGIGAATSVFSLVDAILLGSLPVPNPEDLRVICWTASDARMMYITLTGDPIVPGRKAGGSFSKDVFLAVRERCAAQADIFGYSPFFGAIARARGQPTAVDGLMVSGNFFSGLGIRPLVGSLLGPEDESVASPPRVILSYRWWKRQYGLDPGAVGQHLSINGSSYTIAGVLSPEFKGVCPGKVPDLYVSLAANSLPFRGLPKDLSALWWMAAMGRLRPGVTSAQLETALNLTLTTQADKYLTNPSGYVAAGRDGPAWDRLGYRTQLRLLMTVVGLVLLVACFNISGLLLVRGFGRRHEMALRSSLGASRWRMVRQLMTESSLISVFGGGAGVVVATWGRMMVSRLLAGVPEGLQYETKLDARVLGFALLITLLTALLAGLFPALKATSAQLPEGLHAMVGGRASPLRASQFLVAAQIAFTLVMVTGAGLFFRTLTNLTRIDPGFAMDHLLTFELNLDGAGYQTPRKVDYYEEVLRQVAAVPGVRSAALVNNALLGSWLQTAGFTIPDRASGGESLGATILTVSEGFFQTLGIPLVAGRDFRAGDSDGATRVVVVNESFARKFLPDVIPAGRTLKFEDGIWAVIGVCRDTKCFDLKKGIEPTVFFPLRQRPTDRASIAVRTNAIPDSVAKDVLARAAAVDRNVPTGDVSTEEQLRDRGITPERMLAACSSFLALLVLLLSNIGLFGLMAYDVSRRTTEFGVRMALGAGPADIVLPILQKAMALACIGLGAGLPLTLILMRVIRSYLYGITPSDPGTLGAATSLLLVVAFISAWVPVFRATKVVPMVALRCE